MSHEDRKENILTRKGCRFTKSRKAVVDMLEKAEVPITAEDIYISIKDQGAAANLSTVYRTLELMESKGLVEKVLLNDGKARYKLTGDGHKHLLVCTNCHKTIALNVCPLIALEKDIGEKTQYSITGHRLEIYGVCPECKEE